MKQTFDHRHDPCCNRLRMRSLHGNQEDTLPEHKKKPRQLKKGAKQQKLRAKKLFQMQLNGFMNIANKGNWNGCKSICTLKQDKASCISLQKQQRCCDLTCWVQGNTLFNEQGYPPWRTLNSSQKQRTLKSQNGHKVKLWLQQSGT